MTDAGSFDPHAHLRASNGFLPPLAPHFEDFAGSEMQSWNIDSPSDLQA